jgi:hypothetical protein
MLNDHTRRRGRGSRLLVVFLLVACTRSEVELVKFGRITSIDSSRVCIHELEAVPAEPPSCYGSAASWDVVRGVYVKLRVVGGVVRRLERGEPPG